MDRRITSLAAALLVAGVAVAPSASANGSVAVSIGLPGLAIGFNNHGGGFVAAAPFGYARPAYVAPSVVYPAPIAYSVPVYYPAPVAYRRPVLYARTWAPYRRPVGFGYYGYGPR
jgi:hypothetical protein